jgi:phage-related minor tail protein
MIMKGKNFGESMKALFTDMLATLIATIVQMLIQWAVYQAAQWAMVAVSSAMAAATAAAWATAAAMVSLATMGANAAGAMAGIATTVGFSKSIATLAEGGIVTRPTLALIGEAGPEAVVPLGKGGAGTVINIEINNPNVSSMADIDTLTEEISRRLNAEIERL